MANLTYETLPAPPPLDQLVHCFWFLRGTGDGMAQPVVPDGRAEIVLHLGEPFRAVTGGAPSRQATAMVSGQLTRPLTLLPSADVDVVGIRLRTASARAVLGVSQDELTDQVVDLPSVAPALARRVFAAARAHRSSSRRAAAIVRALTDLVAASPSPVARGTAWALAAPIAPDLRRLARSLGVTTRTLERRCRTEIGVAPATLRRLARFRRAFPRLERTPVGGWARVAAESGYYDQPHMIRDFKEFAGAAPGAFFGRGAELAGAFLSESLSR
jgi:AraC-like DNA-binding protein